jgi:hypothetical protein
LLQKSSLALLGIIAMMIYVYAGWASAEERTADWRFSKAIEVKEDKPNKSKYKSVFMDQAVYAKAREDLGDLRIVDVEGRFIPYYIVSGDIENADKDTVYAAQMVTSIQQDNDTLIDYLIKPQQLNTDIQGNVLKIDLPAQPFLKFVEVSGSYDGNQWELLGKYNLYNTEQLEQSTIKLGLVYKYSHYRLRIIDNVEKLAFPQLELIHNERESNVAQYTREFAPPYTVVEDGRQSLLTIQNEQRLRVKKLSLVVERNFRRSFELVNSNGAGISIVGSHELYSLNFRDIQIKNTSIMLATPNTTQQITLRIDNDDNAPLKIEQVNVEYDIHRLVFEDSGSKSYQLVYGKVDAVKPKYDIEDFRSHIEKENPVLTSLGEQVERANVVEPTKQKPSWFQTKLAFNLVIGFVSLLLVGLLVQKLNKT